MTHSSKRRNVPYTWWTSTKYHINTHRCYMQSAAQTVFDETQLVKHQLVTNIFTPEHSWNYWPRLLLLRTLSRLSSLFKLFMCGGEFPLLEILDLRLRLNFAMSSPNTSPVRRADIRSSNSPLASPLHSRPPADSPFVKPFLRLFPTLARIPSLLFFRSIVRFFSCGCKKKHEYLEKALQCKTKNIREHD